MLITTEQAPRTAALSALRSRPLTTAPHHGPTRRPYTTRHTLETTCPARATQAPVASHLPPRAVALITSRKRRPMRRRGGVAAVV